MYFKYNCGDLYNKQVPYLWKELRLGQRDALDGLFRLFCNSLFDYGIRIINDEELVKDGIQELFLKLWKNHKSLSQAQSVEAYLLLSLRRILLRQVSSRNKRFEHNKTYLEVSFSESFSAEDVIIRGELADEQLEELLMAVNHLTGRQKETLFLRYYHGLTNAEIAFVMNINLQSVRNHLTRAISSLRAIVRSEDVLEKEFYSYTKKV